METKPKIAIVGLSGESVFMKVDHFHSSGETIICEDVYREPGGKGFNQAVAVKRLGGDSFFLSVIGNDSCGDFCEKFLINEGVHSKLIRVNDENTAFATILYNKYGENQVTVYKGASTKLSISDLKEFESIFEDCNFILIQLEVELIIVKKVLEIAQRLNKKVILNPAPAIIKDLELLSQAWLLTPNENEARTIFGLSSEEDIRNVFKKVDKSNINRLIITLGKDGCLVYENKDVVHIPAINVDCIDSTGAGDVFNGALAVMLAKGTNLVESVMFAVKASAFSVMKKYVLQSIPRLDQLVKFGDK